MSGFAEILELGQSHARHDIVRIGKEMRIQGTPALHWVYEVARDCSYIDEVRLTSQGTVVSFKIDRDHEPPRITVDQFSASEGVAS